MIAPSGTLRRPCSRSTLKCSSTSPSSSSLTRKPKPRVASNHFTRPVMGSISAGPEPFVRLHVRPWLPPSARLQRCTHHSTPLTWVIVSANRLYAAVVAANVHAKFIEVDFGARRSRPTIARASAKPWPARTIAAIAFSRCSRIGELSLANGPILPPLGEAKRRIDRLVVGMLVRGRAILLVDPGEPQLSRSSRRLP